MPLKSQNSLQVVDVTWATAQTLAGYALMLNADLTHLFSYPGIGREWRPMRRRGESVWKDDNKAKHLATTANAMNEPYLPAYTLDPLTSMPTRRAFCERVDSALVSSTPRGYSVAVLYLDLAGFKEVNTLHGRVLGDQLLQSVGLRFTRACSEAAMVSRVGSDEFACLLIGLPTSAHLEPSARRIVAAVSEPHRIGAFDFSPTPSIGIVFCTHRDTDADTMLQWAKLAMYRARHEKTGYAFNNYQNYSAPQPLFRFGPRDPN